MERASKRICGRCGSSNLISDRSLGGKIVCMNCGSSFIKTKGIINSGNKYFYFLLFIFLAIFLVIII